MSIRLRLVLLFSVCLLLVFVCLGAVVFRASRAVAQKNFYDMAIAQLQRVEERINTFLAPGFMATEYLATNELIKTSRGRLTGYLDTTENVTLLYANHPPHEQRIYDEFMNIKKYNSNFDLLFMANDDGQYAQAPEGRYKVAGYDPRKRAWYGELMASPDVSAISSPYLTTGADIVCSIMTKTTDDGGRPLGMVGVDYKLTGMTTDLRERRILETGYLVIFDPSGRIVVDGHHPEYVGLLPGEIQEKFPPGDPSKTRRDGSGGAGELRKRLAEGGDGEYVGIGDRELGEYAVTFTVPRLGWKLAVIFESGELLKSSYSTLRYILVVAVPVFVIALLLTALIAFRISQPIRRMAACLSRLALGDIRIDVPPADRERKDEIGLLARSMQEMIESNRDELEIANAYARGDYTHSLPSRSDVDLLGQALDTMMNTNIETWSRVIHLVKMVNSDAEKVSDASQSLSRGVLTSTEALEQVAQAVNNIDQQARDNAQNAQEANKVAVVGRDAAKRGYDGVSDLTVSMADFQQSGRQIREVVKLIDDIAFQTNLLSLNAAVEAARAGKHGKGFSVVADEVRGLAARSAKAAHQTGEMVEAMMTRMEAGTQLAERSDREFREIVRTVDQMTHLFEHISDSSSEQSAAISEIVQSLRRIEAVIEDNNRHADHMQESAGYLSRQADELRQSVSHFRMRAAERNDIQPRRPGPFLDHSDAGQ